MIHMKWQALFSLKNINKITLSSVIILLRTSRAKMTYSLLGQKNILFSASLYESTGKVLAVTTAYVSGIG